MYGGSAFLAVLLLITLLFLLTTGAKTDGEMAETAESVSGADTDTDTVGSDLETASDEAAVSGTASQEEASVQTFTFRDVYGQSYEVALNEDAELHDYEKQYFGSDGERKTYDASGYLYRTGIDVSKFQGDIDWETVASQGIAFAFIRVGNRGYGSEGTLNTDGMYLQNIEGAKAAGIDVGVYFYSQAVSEEEAVEEAEYVLSLLDGMELDYPVVYDEEYVIEDEARTDGVSAEQFTKNALAFCETIEAAGYEPAIYATMKWEAYALEMEKLNAYPKWYADYEEYPQTPYAFVFWQYTNEAAIDGISEPVDLNMEIISEEEYTDRLLSEMTTEEKVAQLFVITPEALSGGQTVRSVSEALKSAMTQYPVGGLIFFSGNLTSYEQTESMLSGIKEAAGTAMKLSPFLAVDEEGGTVARVASNPAMGVENVEDMSEIGKSGDVSLAYEAGDTIGTYLSALGFNLDFAPDADVLTNPDNQVVKTRSFGNDAQLVSEMALACLNGLQEHAVVGVLKHFPGHGATLSDSHDGYAYTDKTYEELEKEELLPFIDGIEEGVSVIMTGHIAAPNVTGNDLPASLSPQLTNEILRERLGYDGLIITDALNMKAISNQYTSGEACIMALEAGADILLMPADFQVAYEGVLSAVSDGRISEERLNESVKRIIKVKLQYLEG